MNAMSSKGHSEHSEQSPSVKNEQAILPNTGKEQDTFRKLQPSASEQDKQAIAPERQFEVEREQKKKDKEREAQKQREKAEEMEKKEKGNGKMEIGNDTANNGKGGDEDEDEDEGSEDVPVYKDKIDTAAKDKSGTDVESIDKSGKKEKSNESNNGDKGATKDGATKGSKVLTSTPGNDDKGADSEKKGKDGVKDLDGPADEAEEGSETKTTKSDEDPEIEAEFQAILKRSPGKCSGNRIQYQKNLSSHHIIVKSSSFQRHIVLSVRKPNTSSASTPLSLHRILSNSMSTPLARSYRPCLEKLQDGRRCPIYWSMVRASGVEMM